jgi:hypothetical protein
VVAAVSDEAWRRTAEGSREALAALGYRISPRCLPGEPQACGGGFAEHAAAHLITLQVVAGHHLEHLDPPAEMVRIIRDQARRDVQEWDRQEQDRADAG